MKRYFSIAVLALALVFAIAGCANRSNHNSSTTQPATDNVTAAAPDGTTNTTDNANAADNAAGSRSSVARSTENRMADDNTYYANTDGQVGSAMDSAGNRIGNAATDVVDGAGNVIKDATNGVENAVRDITQPAAAR